MPQPSPSVNEQRAGSHITVRFRHPDYTADIRAAASKEGLSTNAWIVNILTDAAVRILQRSRSNRGLTLKDSPFPVDYDANDQGELYDDTKWDWGDGTAIGRRRKMCFEKDVSSPFTKRIEEPKTQGRWPLPKRGLQDRFH